MSPRAIATQNGRRAAGATTGGRPGDRNLLRVDRADLRLPDFVIDHLHGEVLRRPIESTQYPSEAFQRLLTSLGITCSMSRYDNVRDDAVIESFFSTLKIEWYRRQRCHSRNDARAEIFAYIERFHSPTRRHSLLGNQSLIDFDQLQAVAEPAVHGTGDNSYC